MIPFASPTIFLFTYLFTIITMFLYFPSLPIQAIGDQILSITITAMTIALLLMFTYFNNMMTGFEITVALLIGTPAVLFMFVLLMNDWKWIDLSTKTLTEKYYKEKEKEKREREQQRRISESKGRRCETEGFTSQDRSLDFYSV